MAPRPTAANRGKRSPAPRQRRPKAQSRRWPGRRRPDRQRASWRWLLVLVVGAVTADVIADQQDGIPRLGTLGLAVGLTDASDEIKVSANKCVDKMGADGFLSSGMGGVRGEARSRDKLPVERGRVHLRTTGGG